MIDLFFYPARNAGQSQMIMYTAIQPKTIHENHQERLTLLICNPVFCLQAEKMHLKEENTNAKMYIR